MAIKSWLKMGRNGFTMIELLVVVVLIGIMTMLIAPTVSGSNVARVRSATRGVMQMSRYARTMAILRQQTIILEISSDGTLRITGESDSDSGGKSAASAPMAAAASVKGSDAGEVAADDPGDNSGGPTRMSSLETEKKYEQVHFEAVIDEDALEEEEVADELTLDSEEEDEEEDEEGNVTRRERQTVRIPYESNGRCLPYRVIVTPQDSEEGKEIDRAVIIIDRFGNAKVEDDDDY